MIDQNIKDLAEQYNNNMYPLPCKNIEKKWIKNKIFYLSDPNGSWHKLWPEKPYSTKKLYILVAGCGMIFDY
jgi:hypothetical protein